MRTISPAGMALLGLLLMAGSLAAQQPAPPGPGMTQGGMQAHMAAMQTHLDSLDARLSELTARMNAAPATGKTGPMLALLNELVTQQRMMHEHMRMMGMMGGASMGMSMGSGAGTGCPQVTAPDSTQPGHQH